MWELGHKANPEMPSSLPVLFLQQGVCTEVGAEVCSCYMYLLHIVSKNLEFCAQIMWLEDITNLNGNINKDNKSYLS